MLKTPTLQICWRKNLLRTSVTSTILMNLNLILWELFFYTFLTLPSSTPSYALFKIPCPPLQNPLDPLSTPSDPSGSSFRSFLPNDPRFWPPWIPFPPTGSSHLCSYAVISSLSFNPLIRVPREVAENNKTAVLLVRPPPHSHVPSFYPLLQFWNPFFFHILFLPLEERGLSLLEKNVLCL